MRICSSTQPIPTHSAHATDKFLTTLTATLSIWPLRTDTKENFYKDTNNAGIQ